MRKLPEAILLDLDDTLYDERTFVESGFRAVAEFLGTRFELDSQELFSTMLVLLEKDGRGRIFDKTLETYSLYSLKLVKQLVDLYRSHKPSLSPYPDVTPSLKCFKKMGIKLGIVTDGVLQVQKNKVAGLGIGKLVDVIIYTDELGSGGGKPNPVGFLTALSALRSEATNSILVGNDPLKDIAGAMALGMETVHIRRGQNPKTTERCCHANLHISDLGQLVNILSGRSEAA